jgi:hypothetical protein
MAPTTEIRSTGRCPHAAARRPQNELTTTTPEALTAITTPMASSLKPSSRASGARIGVTICWPTIRPNTARQTSKIGFFVSGFRGVGAHDHSRRGSTRPGGRRGEVIFSYA